MFLFFGGIMEKSKLKRDLLIIFILYVIADLITTYLVFSNGGGEANHIVEALLPLGYLGFFGIFFLKLGILIPIVVCMYFLYNYNFPVLYKFFSYTLISFSCIVILNNLLVLFINKDIFGVII